MITSLRVGNLAQSAGAIMNPLLSRRTEMGRFLFHAFMTVITGGVWLVALLFYKFVVQNKK
jgi:hypothetical protein